MGLAQRAEAAIIRTIDLVAAREVGSPEPGVSLEGLLQQTGVRAVLFHLATSAPEEVAEDIRSLGDNFAEAGCQDDRVAISLLEDRLEAAARDRSERFVADPSTAPSPGREGQQEADTLRDYVSANLLAVIRTRLRLAAADNGPEGFPAPIPVHAEARLLDTTGDERSARATWVVRDGAARYEEVRLFYADQLQSLRTGWGSQGDLGSTTVGQDDVVRAGRVEHHISGHGWSGTVTLQLDEASDEIVITAVLTRS